MAAAGDSLRRLAQRAERMATNWPRTAAAEAATEIERVGRADTGGDGRLSHGRNLGSASVTVRGRGRSVSAVAASPRLWGVLQKAGRRPRRSWSKGVAKALPKAKRSADQAVREVIG